MKTILDASALINLSNGRVLDAALRLPDCTFSAGPQVIAESVDQARDIALAFANGLARLNDDLLPAALFLSLLEEFGLGLGETECLAFAIHGGYTICIDDRKARECCIQKLGGKFVIGTIGLLKRCVNSCVLTTLEAMTAYELMKSKGGFLPSIVLSYFEA